MVKIETRSKISICRKLFFQNGSSYITAVDYFMPTKFGLLIDVDLRKRVTSSNTKPEVVCSRRGRRIEIVYDVIIPPRVAQFGNLGM